jgi:SAM-dependent methyltransferase
VEGYDASTYGDRFADVYDQWYDDPEGTAAIIERLTALAGAVAQAPPTEVLELGVGTGRLAVPLATAGIAVTGIDASPEMLRRLHEKAAAAGAGVTAVHGDMAGPLPDGPFDLVVVAHNTFFNLTTEDAQQACLAEIARVLAPAGRFVIEAFVPATEAGSESSVQVRSITADRVVLFVDRHDPERGEAWSSFVDITEGGIRLRPCHVRYLSPDALDAMASAAGLVLDERAADWTGAPFDDGSTHHVSVYRRG